MSGEVEYSAHPRMLRRQALIWTVVLGGAAVFGWFALPASIRVLFTGLQVGTLLFFLLFMLGIVWVAAFGYVKAGPHGLTFRNGLRTHHVGWAQVEGIRYRSADHWAFVDLTDETDRMLLGIQRSDGHLADEDVAALRALHARHTGQA